MKLKHLKCWWRKYWYVPNTVWLYDKDHNLWTCGGCLNSMPKEVISRHKCPAPLWCDCR